MFVDTHCHIYKDYYEDIDLVLNEAKKNNVGYIINSGCDRMSNREVLDLLNGHKNMYGAIGIHPESVLDYTEEDIKFIEEHLNDEKIVAIGEIGLDYHYTNEDKEEQIKLFEAQLKLAEKYHKPVIIHSREATADTISILKKYNVKGVIHSFSGSYETAMIYIKMGYLLGVNGVVTFKNSNLKDVLKRIPLEHIILETDSPYLTPVPFRGKQNVPKYVIHVAEFLSELYDVSLDELAKVTNSNIKHIFDINM